MIFMSKKIKSIDGYSNLLSTELNEYKNKINKYKADSFILIDTNKLLYNLSLKITDLKSHVIVREKYYKELKKFYITMQKLTFIFNKAEVIDRQLMTCSNLLYGDNNNKKFNLLIKEKIKDLKEMIIFYEEKKIDEYQKLSRIIKLKNDIDDKRKLAVKKIYANEEIVYNKEYYIKYAKKYEKIIELWHNTNYNINFYDANIMYAKKFLKILSSFK